MHLRFVIVSVILAFGCINCIVAEDTDSSDNTIQEPQLKQGELNNAYGYKNLRIINKTGDTVFIDVLPIVCGKNDNPSNINNQKIIPNGSYAKSITYKGTDNRPEGCCINNIDIIIDGLKRGPMIKTTIGNASGTDGINNNDTITIAINEPDGVSHAYSYEGRQL